MRELGTREQSIEAIEKAESLSEVLDLANAALAGRGQWGDGLTASKAAATKWGGLFFPVDCEQAGAKMGSAHVERTEFIELGVRAAKAVAIALLAPLPTVAKNGSELDESGLVAGWSAVSEEAEKALNKALQASKATSSVIACHAFGHESLYTNKAKEFESAKHAKDWAQLEAALVDPGSVGLQSSWWDDVRPAVEKTWQDASSDASALSEAMRASGAGFVLAGPSGGMATIAKGASMLAKAYGELAQKVGVPKEALNLGMEGLGLNLFGVGHTAYFNPLLKLMAFPTVISHVAHEWTHLLDSAIGKKGTPMQQQALAELKKAPLNMGPDPALRGMRLAEALAEQRENLGWYLESKCKDSSVKSFLEKASVLDDRGSVASQPLCTQDFMEQAKAECSGGLEGWTAFLMKHHDSSKALINPEGAKAVYRALREAWDLDGAVQIESEFVRIAKEHDGRGYAKKGYFMDPKELIARIGEAHFSGLGASPSLAWSKGDDRTPQGGEAVELSKSYSKLMAAFAAEPECLAERSLGKLREAKKAEKQESVGVVASVARADSTVPKGVELASWRSKRSSSGSQLVGPKSKGVI